MLVSPGKDLTRSLHAHRPHPPLRIVSSPFAPLPREECTETKQKEPEERGEGLSYDRADRLTEPVGCW